MPEKIRALIVILALAVPAFYTGKRLASSVISNREFVVWRNAWFAVTVVAFLSGSYIIYAVMMVVICIYGRSGRAANVGLFFVLLLALPLAHIPIGGADIVNRLFDFNNARLLAIVFLLPILIRGVDRPQRGIYPMPDRLIVGYVLLLTALEFRNSGATNVMRQATLYTLDVLIPYFAFSRTVTSMADFRKVFLAYVIAVLPLSLIAAFELARGWHLYATVAQDWGMSAEYLRREGLLRATASAFGSIPLGFIVMVAIGCMLGIWQTVQSSRFTRVALTIFAIGLLASLSRGPWVGGAVVLLVYLAIGRNAVINIGKFVMAGAVALMFFLFMPSGQRLLDTLPFIGSVEQQNVTYRLNLFENAIVVIKRHPWLGSTDYLSTPELRELMQGEGIIDLVNTYLQITLKSGLIGLGLFVAFFATILMGLWRSRKFHAVGNVSFNAYVRASLATVIGILATIATVSSVDFIPYVYWSFAGLCVALIRIGFTERVAAARAVHAARVTV